ncbi:MAG: hypothetical protein ABIH89_02355 [Elusimicrobiota bacterium]
MRIVLLYWVFFAVILFAFFIPVNDSGYCEPFEGIVYSSSLPGYCVPESLVHTTLYRNTDIADLPGYSFFTKLSLPHKFIGRLKPADEADFVITGKDTDKKVKTSPGSTAKKVIKPETGPTPIKREIVKKKTKEIVFNYHILKNVVKDSDKSYFFSNISDSDKQVTLSVYSVTPWRNKYILDFRINNMQDKYFFISNISVYDMKDNFISAEFFYEPLIASEKTLSGFILLPDDAGKELKISVFESGGLNRIFTANFIIP